MCLLQSVPGCDGAEVSSIVWVADPIDQHWRLFSAQLNGQIQEINFQQLQPVAGVDSYGGAVWCLAVQPPSAVAPGTCHATPVTFLIQHRHPQQGMCNAM